MLTQVVTDIDLGETVPGVLCPSCGSDVLRTSSGAFCDWCNAYVPVIGQAVVIDDSEDDESDWIDPEDAP